jgi:hypothetical protein
MTHNVKLKKLSVDASKKNMNIWKEMSHYWLMTLSVFQKCHGASKEGM